MTTGTVEGVEGSTCCIISMQMPWRFMQTCSKGLRLTGAETEAACPPDLWSLWAANIWCVPDCHSASSSSRSAVELRLDTIGGRSFAANRSVTVERRTSNKGCSIRTVSCLPMRANCQINGLEADSLKMRSITKMWWMHTSLPLPFLQAELRYSQRRHRALAQHCQK